VVGADTEFLFLTVIHQSIQNFDISIKLL
jgi:hypothetical protein